MSDLLYDGVTREDWVKELSQDNIWNKRHFLAMLAVLGMPEAMLDIGCGLGEVVTLANHMQIKSFGVDQLVNEDYKEEWFIHADLSKAFSLAEHKDISITDLVLCWEVAEHIPDDGLGIFCDNICNHLRRDLNSHLVFTAAHPGQSGKEHVNARPSIFWRDEFYHRGLDYDPNKTAKLSLAWSNLNSPKYWLSANLQVFSKG